GRISFDRVDAPSYRVKQFGSIGFEINSPVHEHGKSGEDLEDTLARAFADSIKVHLHPRRNARDERHVSAKGLVDNALQFFLPVVDAVGLVGWILVAAQIARHVMVHDTRQSARFYAGCFGKGRTS